jgi:aspartate-semialdehyde dehydrogenase
MTKTYNIAIVGATGAVGTKMLEMLEASSLPIGQLSLLASARSAGKTLTFRGNPIQVEELTADAFSMVDIALFSAGGNVSKVYAPIAVAAGAIVVDNTSYFRQEANVPLVVPEVNPQALADHQGIIACPNCSTIQMMVALEPIRQVLGLRRIIVSTYQAVSGAGARAMQELTVQLGRTLYKDEQPKDMSADILPAASDTKHYPIAFNAIPQIDVFGADDYTQEEWKLVNETKKIMGDDTIQVAATCVRIPVLTGHSESIYIEVEQDDVTPDHIRNLLENAPGVILQDDPSQQLYPQAIYASGQCETFVGRIRRDIDHPRGFHLWVVSDNLLKGAAWNSVQIAEELVARGLV